VAFALTAASNIPPSSFTVPAAQRLVIEYVSGACGFAVAAGTSAAIVPPSVGISTVLNGVTSSHGIALPFVPFLSISPNVPIPFFEFGHLVKVYADPGTSVTLNMVPSGNPNVMTNFSVTISGQFVTP
jgi:hypothetical protein